MLDTQVRSLGLGQLGHFHAELLKVQTGDFFVQVLGQGVDSLFVLAGIALDPKLELCQDLVGEARAHHEAWVPCGATKVHQAAFGQHKDASLGLVEIPLVELSLDVATLSSTVLLQLLKTGHIDLVVEVPDIADDRLVLHLDHVLGGDDVLVARGRHEDVGSSEVIFNRLDFVTFHRGLQSADRIDFGDDHSAALTSQGLATTLTHIAVTANHCDLTGEHHVGSTVQPVDERMAATV